MPGAGRGLLASRPSGASTPLSIPSRSRTFHFVIILARRLRAALILGVFLTGTFGVPIADAAMFHLAGRDPCAGVTHIEAHGGQHHADHCTLAQPVAAQRESIGSAQAVRVAPPMAARAITPDAAVPTDTELVALQHSRAPPA